MIAVDNTLFVVGSDEFDKAGIFIGTIFCIEDVQTEPLRSFSPCLQFLAVIGISLIGMSGIDNKIDFRLLCRGFSRNIS